tara:strand:- start:7063 stop:7599 length:537 start_codon:yes stop_codon:yes gene_type:complete
MWKDILKSPYKIQSTIFDSNDYPTETYINTYNKLFQGTQGKEDTEYWTPSLDEALIYAIFGSSRDRIKLKDKPMIKQALKTNKEKWLEGDREYTDNRNIRNKKEMGMPRGISLDNIDYKYLPDSRVKELIVNLKDEIDDGLTHLNATYIASAIGLPINIDTENEMIFHIDKILEKYFG